MRKNPFQTPSIESETIESLSAKLLETTAELTRSNQKLRKVQKERAEMLANISHDLRAPITAIRSAVDYLTSGQQLSQEDYEISLQLINRRTETLETLIEDLYYLFCAEDTSHDFTRETIPAAPFFEEYFFDATADNRYAEHQLHLDLPMDLDCNIHIDIQKMIRVLDNLFTNAAKYSGKDTDITLRVYTENSKSLLISVIDNGVGIPADSLGKIFNRTYTVSSARTPGAATGSGLGLAIAKTIVERHGGSIHCESGKGNGCCFTIQLPIL